MGNISQFTKNLVSHQKKVYFFYKKAPGFTSGFTPGFTPGFTLGFTSGFTPGFTSEIHFTTKIWLNIFRLFSCDVHTPDTLLAPCLSVRILENCK